MTNLVLGAGAWGTTIANLIASNTKSEVILWSFEKNVAEEINKYSENKTFLPGIRINKKIIATNRIPSIKLDFIFLVNPSQNIDSVIKKIYKSKNFTKMNSNPKFIICSKGIDYKKKKLLSCIVKEYFPKSFTAILSGPTFAIELAKRLPTAATLACEDMKTGKILAKLLSTEYFRIYFSKDIVGVQLSGTLKNILAIAAGVTEGLNLGKNARAAIISRGIKEIIKIVVFLGGKEKTIMGLAGLGDIFLTCNSRTSRNFNFGYQLGKGNIDVVHRHEEKKVTEGYKNIRVIYDLKKKSKLETPIIDSVYDILVKKRSINQLVNELMSRPIKDE
ncbi:MAG: hypothetical protein CBE11_01610 [Rickettsiales bacterium TMED251]|nr:MAG: hypothetical protein CBE11_01610 [Rickettsiales bacterium TMED251]|tara:strand:+ start:455 stop:1453 length:999 start_codon:yes stop_codon:yes gene_type:complete